MTIRGYIREATSIIFPFVAGAAICRDALHRAWVEVGTLVVVLIILTAAQLRMSNNQFFDEEGTTWEHQRK
jgi:hypothetical protein